MKLIKCNGRYSTHGKIPCKDNFEYYGEYGDDELWEHQKKEMGEDSKHDWWTGFDNDPKFIRLQENYDNALQKTISKKSN